MKLIPAKTPGFIKSLFPNFIWNIDTKEKELYLTFDDGPTPEITNWVLESLASYNAKATFFCIGNNIEKHPELFKKITEGGHGIGNHTFSHLKGWKNKTKKYIKDTERAQKSIAKFASNKGKTPLFRPPYGKLKTKQSKSLHQLGYKIIMWDVLSFDWDSSVSKENCLKNVIDSAKEGSVIVFHDSVKASGNLKFALLETLKHFSKKGYVFKALN